jgi:hypothetical protein
MEKDILATRIYEHLMEMSAEYGNDFIVIGGWAAFAYGVKEVSFDGDAMVSHVALGAIRDEEVVIPNYRPRKSQYMRDGFDVDLYVEHHHGLRVPFDEIQARALMVQNLNVPCPEHLFILKIDAARGRYGSEKGLKDLGDVLGLIDVMAKAPDCSILSKYLTESDAAFTPNGNLSLDYAKFRTQARISPCDHDPRSLLSLDTYCQEHGIPYFVETNHPTQFNYEETGDRVWINIPERTLTLPREAQDNPVLTLEILAYVAHKYDARETAARFFRQQLSRCSQGTSSS